MTSRKAKGGGIAVAGVVMIFVAVVVYNHFFPPKPKTTPDALCSYVTTNLGADMKCVSVLASEKIFGPGNYVAAPPPDQLDQKINFSLGNIFQDSCRVPGSDTTQLQQAALDRKPVSIPSIEFEANQTLRANSALDIPGFNNTEVDIGPSWNQVTKVDLVVAKAWFLTLDEHDISQAIASCDIKEACVRNILNGSRRLIEGAVVGDGVQFSLKDRNGRTLSAASGAIGKMFSVKVEGAQNQSADETATLKASDPVVLAVRLLSIDTLQSKATCPEEIAYSASGDAIVRVSGGGGKGNIGPSKTATAQLGETAKIDVSGTEESECEISHDLTRSAAHADASVSSVDQKSLQLSYHLSAQGGHYATVDGCVLGKAIGYHGNDNSVSSSVELRGEIRAIVRTDSSRSFAVTYSALPDKSNLQVLDSAGQPVPLFRQTEKGDRVRVEPGSTSGAGTVIFLSNAAGVYTIRVVIPYSSDVSGAGTERAEKTGQVSLAPFSN